MSKISIITTTYNHQDFIADTIQSILNQSISDRELLIGDDSPGDETWKIIQKYTKKYPDKIKAWHHSPNKWIVENMNFLINKISKESKYIAFLEGDDLREKDCLKSKLDIFDIYPKVQLVYNNLDFIDKHNNIIQKDIFGFRKIGTYQNTKISPDTYVSANVWPIISWSTAMVTRSMIDKYSITSLHPDSKTYSVSDYDFYFQVATNYPIYYIDKSLTLYRRHQSNLSASNPKLMEELSGLITLYKEKKYISNSIFSKKMSHNKLIQSIIYLENWNRKKSFEYLKKSLNYSFLNHFIMKIAVLKLICLPLFVSKFIFSKIIKRG